MLRAVAVLPLVVIAAAVAVAAAPATDRAVPAAVRVRRTSSATDGLARVGGGRRRRLAVTSAHVTLGGTFAAGSTTTERELDISDTTYAVSSTTASARAPHSLPELSPRVASVEQLARCDTTRGLTRYRPESSVRHRSQRTSMSATCPKPCERHASDVISVAHHAKLRVRK